MSLRITCPAAWVLLAAALFLLPGCNNDPFRIQLVNEGAYPITEVLVYPVTRQCEEPRPEAQLNRMPKDESGATIALPPGDETLLPGSFPQDVYEISVTFYDSVNQVFRQAHSPYSFDLTYVKSGYPVVVRAAMDTNNTPTINVEFTTKF